MSNVSTDLKTIGTLFGLDQIDLSIYLKKYMPNYLHHIKVDKEDGIDWIEPQNLMKYYNLDEYAMEILPILNIASASAN